MTTTEQRLADALRAILPFAERDVGELAYLACDDDSEDEAMDANADVERAREALAAYDAQQAQAAGLDEAIMQMGKPWHLSGAAEEYGFYHGKVAAAMLVRKSLGPLRAAEDETHA